LSTEHENVAQPGDENLTQGSEEKHDKPVAHSVDGEAIQSVRIDKPSKQDQQEEKRVWRQITAAGIVAAMQERGTIVLDEGTPVFMPNADQNLSSFSIEKGNVAFETFVHRCTLLTPSEYDGKVVLDHVRMLARRKAESRKVITFSEFQQSQDGQLSIVLTDADGIIRVRAGAVERITPETAGCYIEPVGLPWTYRPLSDPELAEAGRLYKHLLASSQACAPQSRMALAVAVPALTFVRQMLDVRPIFEFTGGAGTGKSFNADHFGYLVYGQTALTDTTEAALKRATDPLVILDDVERLPVWMKDHLRRSATGIKRMSVRSAKDNFQVDKGDPIQSIYILTAIRIPVDSALLTRTWLFNYSKDNFRDEFKDEMRLRQEILDNRDTLLSFWLHLLAEIFKLQTESNWPDLSVYEPLPAPRTQLAQRVLLQALRAYERLSPGIFDPEAEFTGFIQQQRGEDNTRHGQSAEELTLLDQLMEDFELEHENGLHMYAEDGKPLEEGMKRSKVTFNDGALIGSATAIGELMLEKARSQGIRLHMDMSAINVGKWLSSEVRDSADFTAEECSIGSGIKKRSGWKIMRRVKP
jgi:hypothetical protein